MIDESAAELSMAMLKAKEAFEQYFEDQGYDAAYWALDLKGYVLSIDLNPLHEIEIKDYSSGTRVDKTWEERKNE